MRQSSAIILAIIILSFAIGIYLYPSMPESMASHWNAAGEVDGYMPKFWGLFLMPAISFGMFLLFVAIPRIDPLKENIEKFRKYYGSFIVLMIMFLFYIYLLSVSWNLGARFNFARAMVPPFAVLFYYAGVLTGHAKRNWFIGIRTPWTLSSDAVWDKTHAVGAKLFKASAVISLVGLAFPKYAIFFVVAPVVFVAVYTVIYSYLEYQKNK